MKRNRSRPQNPAPGNPAPSYFDLLAESRNARQDVSRQGYRDGSPYGGAPFLDIETPGGGITMRGVSRPLLGMTPQGERQVMVPGGEYRFDSPVVREMPLPPGMIQGIIPPEMPLPQMQFGDLVGGMMGGAGGGAPGGGGMAGFLQNNGQQLAGIGNVGASVLQGIASNRAPASPIEQQALQAAADSPMAGAGYAAGEAVLQGAANAVVPGAGTALKAVSGLVDAGVGAIMTPEQQLKNNNLKFTRYLGAPGYLIDRAIGRRKMGKYNARKGQLGEIEEAQNIGQVERNNNSGTGDYSPMYREGGLTEWFAEGAGGGGWDRYDTTGKRIGKCGDGKDGEGYAACLSLEKAQKLGKAGIASFVRRKRAAQRDAGRGRKGDAGKGSAPIRVSTGASKKEDGGFTDGFAGGFMPGTDQMESQLAAFKSGGNTPTDTALWSRAKSRARQKFDVYPCVPMDSQALTRRGWVGPDDLAVGDEILAYDIEDDILRWTPVLNIHRHENAPVTAWSNAQSRWTIRSTPDHNWVMFRSGQFHPRKADASISDGRKARSRQGRRLTPIDKAPAGVSNILVAAKLSMDEPSADLTRFTKYGQSWVETVLRMSRDQLESWLAAAIVYDGYEHKSSFGFSQKDPDHLMALELAAALTGHVVTEAKYADRSVTSVQVLQRRHIQIQYANRVELNRQPVWCPQTQYGTWLMRQSGFITITGNSAYANAWAVQWYGKQGGGWRKAEDGMMVEGMADGMPDDPTGGYDIMEGEGGVYLKPRDKARFAQWAAASGMGVQQAAAQLLSGGNEPEMPTPQGEMPEMKEGGIPERYKSKGFARVGAKKNSTRPGKKWMVLARKGEQYKVVHGGDSNMKDYTQHGSGERRKRFWSRMGGRDSAKANDPFSPLHWHKKFGTW